MTLSKWAQNLSALHTTTTTQNKQWVYSSTDKPWPNKTMQPAQKLLHMMYRSIQNQPIGYRLFRASTFFAVTDYFFTLEAKYFNIYTGTNTI
jgi:hypothetical protein